jgi:hypothetical protein
VYDRSFAVTITGEFGELDELGELGEFGDIGLCRGALDEEEDKPRRVKSILKFEGCEREGNGEELLRVRVCMSEMAMWFCKSRPSPGS